MKTYGEYLYLQIHKANCIIKDLERLQCAEFDKETRNDMLQRVVIKGEALANNLRQMLLQYSVVTPEIHKEQISRRNGYLVYGDGEDTVIELPQLPLRQHRSVNCRYIIDPLLYSLEQYIHETGHHKYDYCTIKITHVFTEDTTLRQIHDYDNLEVKKVLDAISLYLMVDDNIKRCHVYHMSAVGDELWTQIRICPMEAGDKKIVKRGNKWWKTDDFHAGDTSTIHLYIK